MLKLLSVHRVLISLLFLAVAVHVSPAGAENDTPAATPAAESALHPADPVYAKVNGKPITTNEYKMLLSATMRQRFYHGNAPDAQTEAVRKEVSELLVDRTLLVEEAERRGLQPDTAAVERAVADVDARYANAPRWKQQRDQLLPAFKRQIAQQGQLDRLEKEVRDGVPLPSKDEARSYYDKNPGLFTEPEKLRMSVIMVNVDPSSPTESWEKAAKDAQAIYERIKNGADFSEEARHHSTDKTASSGGDLGYVHRGMLPEALEEKIDKFEVGATSEPIAVLEGVALFRVDERVESKLRDFADVAARAQELLKRERQDQAWRDTIKRLRDAASIEFLMPISAEAPK